VNIFEGMINNKVFLGGEIDYVITIGNKELQVKTHPDIDIRINHAAKIAVSPQKCFAILEREDEEMI
jgi:hypothetical protein